MYMYVLYLLYVMYGMYGMVWRGTVRQGDVM